jgi:hypothetical protein
MAERQVCVAFRVSERVFISRADESWGEVVDPPEPAVLARLVWRAEVGVPRNDSRKKEASAWPLGSTRQQNVSEMTAGATGQRELPNAAYVTDGVGPPVDAQASRAEE